jgi:O-antigen/teichoic acid export membrane protein
VAVAKVLADFLVALLSVGWVRKHHGPLQPPTARAPVLDLARAGAPIAGTQLLRGLTRTSDIVILGFMVSRVQLGYYSAAARIFLLMLSLAGSYFVILLPRMAERAADPAGAMRRELRASLRRSLPIALLGCVLVALFAQPLLASAFDSEFAAAAPALQLLTLALIANFIGRHHRQVLIARGRQGLDLRMTGIGAATHVAAKLALIPPLGITGAALGTLAGELTIAVLLGWVAWSDTRTPSAWLDRREEER